MDLNDLLADVDGIGREHDAATATANPLPASGLPANAQRLAGDEKPFRPGGQLPAMPDEDIELPAHQALRAQSTTGTMSPKITSLDLIMDVELEVLVELGETRIPLKRLMAIQAGDSFTLEGRADAPLKIFVNELLVAYGEPLVVDGSLAIRLVELLPTGTEG